MLTASPQLRLRVERRRTGTVLAEQYVGYPFHLTRPFRLDTDVAEVSTLYLQSSSGGLYAGERLAGEITLGAGAALHLTTQGSTIVHGHRGRPARSRLDIRLGPGSFLAFTPDPQILFPGSAAETELDVEMAPDAHLFLSDGFLLHDPGASGEAPVSFRSTLVVRREGSPEPLFADRQRVGGAHLADPSGPLHGHRLSGNAFHVAPEAASSHAGVARILEGLPLLAGASVLPDECGTLVRLLAEAGHTFQTAAARLFADAFAHRFGCEPAPRRK